MIDEFRALSEEELDRLVFERRRFVAWRKFKQYADDFYGPSAALMTIETISEYNDEGGSNESIESIHVSDRDGNRMDFSLPSNEIMTKYSSYYTREELLGAVDEDGNPVERDEDYDVYEERYDYIHDFLSDVWYKLGVPEEELFEYGRYGDIVVDVSQEPERAYKEVYVKDLKFDIEGGNYYAF